MSLLHDIKKDIKSKGGAKGKMFFLKPESKTRIRFLEDFEDGHKIPFHDNFEAGINVPCQEIVAGKSCDYCDEESLRDRDNYAWCVWNYDAKEVQIFLFAANTFTPIPGIASGYELRKTLLDRDYVIGRNEKGKGYTVDAMDKARFRNSKAKPYSIKKIYDLLQKAFPLPDEDEDEDFEEDDFEEKPRKKGKKKPVEDDDWDYEEDEDDEIDYEEMKPIDLFKLCKERGIKAKPKKSQDYYIDLLEEYDEETEDDEDDDDAW